MKTDKAIDYFLKNRRGTLGLSPDTLRWYRGILEAFGSSYTDLPRGPAAIDEFLDSLDCGDERKAGYYRAVHALYRFLRRRELIRNNPMDLMDPPRRSRKLPRPLTADQLDQLIRYPHAAKVKACLRYLADTGCRVGELYNLNDGSFTETPQGWLACVRGKTGERFVPMSVETYRAISAVLPLGWSKYRLRINIKKAFEAAHVPGSAHTLRHTFGTLWRGDELALQRIMGHSSLATTQIYRQLDTSRLSEQHNQYSPLRLIFGRSLVMI